MSGNFEAYPPPTGSPAPIDPPPPSEALPLPNGPRIQLPPPYEPAAPGETEPRETSVAPGEPTPVSPPGTGSDPTQSEPAPSANKSFLRRHYTAVVAFLGLLGVALVAAGVLREVL